MFSKPKFLTDLVLRRYIEAKNDKTFFVDQEYRVSFARDGKRERYAVPSGFSTDLASVPLGFRNVASKMDGIEASIVHDHMYYYKTQPRAEADAIFLMFLKAGGVGWFKRNAMYSAVRMGGWTIYSKDRS